MGCNGIDEVHVCMFSFPGLSSCVRKISWWPCSMRPHFVVVTARMVADGGGRS